MNTARNHDRRPDNTNFSISLPREILHQLDHLAEDQHRSRSNMIAVIIDAALHPPEK